MSDKVVYTSCVRVERVRGPLRRVFIPHEDTPIYLSVHSEIAEHYGVDMAEHETHATTLDYLVTAAAG